MTTEQRKGLLTPAQEKTADRVIEFKRKALEAADGPAIKIIDNRLIDPLIDKLNAKHPGAIEIVYEMVDAAFNALDVLFPEEEPAD